MLSMPVTVADRTSAELSAAQGACVVPVSKSQQDGCVGLPDPVMMLAGSTIALGAQTTDQWPQWGRMLVTKLRGTCLTCHNNVVSLAQLITTKLWHLLTLQCSASR